MTTAATVDEFVDRILASGLLSAHLLSQLELAAGDSPVEVARLMVKERLLTPFQARSLLAGEGRSFFVTERYKILEHLGRGGMGEVYLVEQLLLRRVAAMKLILAGDPKSGSNGAGAVERFFREARAVAALDHPNVVRVFDMDRTPVGPFLVMEYVDGTNLHAVVSRSGPLAVERAVDAVRQAASGLAQAHAKGLIHRDVKPGNLLLDRVGNVKVVDLGLARYRDANENAGLTGMYDDNRVIGTADFQAPEQGLDSGSADARSDVYGLGATLFYLLTGRVPFPEGTISNKLLAHQMKPVPDVSELNPDVPPDLAAVVGRMMAKRPVDRPQSMEHVRAVLAPWAADELSPPPASEMPKHPPAAYRLGLCPPPAAAPPAPAPVGRSGPPTGYVHRSASAMVETPQSYRTAPASMRMPRPAPPVSMRMPKPGAGSARMPKLTTEIVPSPPVDTTSDDYAPVSLNESGGSQPSGPQSGETVQTVSRRTLLLGCGGGLVASALAAGVYWYATSSPSGGTRRTAPVSPPPTPPTAPPSPPPPPPVTMRILGGGSSFIYPAMQQWSEKYRGVAGVDVEYKSTGSSDGVRNVLNGVFPFGCTEAPVEESQAKAQGKALTDVIHLPLAFGGLVPTYNMPGLNARLKFSPAALAGIYAGTVTKWNDELIKLGNPGLNLPAEDILVVHRSDGSGSTFVWMDYLCTAAPLSFPQSIKGGKPATTWEWVEGRKPPKVQSGARTQGVADTVLKTPYSIGYVELSYALEKSLPVGMVKNKEGQYVDASLQAVTAAAANKLKAGVPNDLRFSLVDAPGVGSYPICSAVWAVMFAVQPRGKEREEMVKFLRWISSENEGQKLLPDLRYAPLPSDLVKMVHQKLDSITWT